MDQEIKKEFEDLTKIVKSGFDAMDKKFGEVEVRLDRMDQRFDSFETRLAEIQSELETVRLKLEALERRVREDADALVKDVLELRERLNILERQVKQMQMSLGKV